MVVARLDRIAARAGAVEQTIDQHASAATLVAIDHDAGAIASYRRDRLRRRSALEARESPRRKTMPLEAAVSRNQIQRGREKQQVVDAGVRV